MGGMPALCIRIGLIAEPDSRFLSLTQRTDISHAPLELRPPLFPFHFISSRGTPCPAPPKNKNKKGKRNSHAYKVGLNKQA
jgi:hypothetical protein